MQNLFQTFGGWVVPIVVAFLGWLYQTRKVKIEESDIILSRWKDFSDTHQADMKRLREEYSSDRTRLESDLATVRKELKDLQADFALYRRESEERAIQIRRESEDQIRSRDLEIKGLQATIRQISQSTAIQIGRVKDRAKDAQVKAAEAEDQIANLTADKNAAHCEIHDEIDECVQRLDRIGDNSSPKEPEK